MVQNLDADDGVPKHEKLVQIHERARELEALERKVAAEAYLHEQERLALERRRRNGEGEPCESGDAGLHLRWNGGDGRCVVCGFPGK